jgi:uncharacterized protein (TIGR03067 family)
MELHTQRFVTLGAVVVAALGFLGAAPLRAGDRLAVCWLPTATVGLPALTSPQTAGPDEIKERLKGDVKLLEDAGVATDGPALLEFFRKKTLTEEQRHSIGKLIEQLADPVFKVREKATQQLLAIGPPALAALRQALNHPDVEVVARAKRCLSAHQANYRGELLIAAAWVLADRQPPQAVEVLLAFLPDVADDAVEDEMARALGQLGVRDGQPAAALVAATKDPLVARRLAGAAALARAAGADNRAAARKMLLDASPRVRLFTAHALLAVGDKAAVPTLIALLGEAPAFAGPAEDLLFLLAEKLQPPAAPVQRDADSLNKYRTLWTAWWKDNEAKVDLARFPLEGRSPALVLLGTWKMTAVSIKGMEIPIPAGQGPALKFTKDGKLLVDSGGKSEEGTYRIQGKNGIDLTITQNGKTETMRAIFEISKDTLKLGFAGFGSDATKLDRPKGFDGDTTVMVLKKQ